jgi:beta-carotene hydroxylase
MFLQALHAKKNSGGAPTIGDGHNPPLAPADEKRIARELSPAVAWPTLAMAVLLPATYWTLAGLGLARIVPLWACAPILTFLSYAHYTLVHESIHGNLAPGYPRLRWLNTLVGWLGAIGLGYNWPIMMRTHVLHHAHTNTDQDPDIVVKGTFGQLLVKWFVRTVIVATIPLFVLRWLAPAKYRKAAAALLGAELWQASAVAVLVLALLAAATLTGSVADWLCLLFIPTRSAGLIINIFFQWLPHYPFERAERYLNTRISLWAGATALTLQQNLHLMHHLWPSVPFYNYGRLYRRMRTTLIAKGSRIEGLRVGAYTRDRSTA